jgi:glycosyltransferase involved in cell wall biosynthesis
MKNKPLISVVSPVYGASSLLVELVRRIKDSVKEITEDYEIILVEDNGKDDSWKIIKTICDSDKRVIGIQHSRNFGQQYALNCGLDHAKGEWVVTLDCDLQDRPEEIVNLFNKANEGYDIVLASRQNRQDDFMKKLFSKLFYRLLSYLTDTHQDATLANFSLYHRSVVNALKSMNDYSRYYPTMIHWIGFRLVKLEIQHQSREDGIKSSYSFKKRIKLAFDIIISFSNKPLRLTVKLGVFILFLATLVAVMLVVGYFFTDIYVSGWASTFLSLWFLAGIIITIQGMIGIYVGKIFETVKRRPSYIVGQIINYEDQIVEKC